MFGKKNNLDKKNIIYNLDKVPVADLRTGEFLLPFNERQQAVLEHCLTLGIPIGGIAYAGFPAEMMLYVSMHMIDNWWAQSPNGTKQYNKKMDRIDFAAWEIVHTDFKYLSQFIYSCRLLGLGINAIEELNDATSYNSKIWRDICYLMDYEHKDYIPYVNRHGASVQSELDEKFMKSYLSVNSPNDYANEIVRIERFDNIAYWKYLEGKYTFEINEVERQTAGYVSPGEIFIARYYQKFPPENKLYFA